MKRRDTRRNVAPSGSGPVSGHHAAAPAPAATSNTAPQADATLAARLPDLSPARWIWYPAGRTLQNTFVLFRRELVLRGKPRRATGWIIGESRYLLEVNGERIQWGPAPADPRWPEADPLDLTGALQDGPNVIGATVLFYGQGDGTCPLGKAGFLFWLEIEHADGHVERIVSDDRWRALLARAWPAGHYKRWYLRALQEEFDARLHPHGWSQPDYTPTADWLPPLLLAGSPNRPALATSFYEYMLDLGEGPPDSELRPRSIPLLRESIVPVAALTETLTLAWARSPEEYFAVRTADAFSAERGAAVRATAPGEWQVTLDGTHSVALTFELGEQMVGWPRFTIEAPAGTVIELLVQEGHAAGGPALLNTHFDAWTRFICRAGVNRFESFDFESLRWLQLHVRHATGTTVTIREVGVRRRIYPWPHPAAVRTSEPALQRLFDASVNTLHNCAQETLVDGMGRERQQYSGDGGHQLHAVHLAFGESRLPGRYVRTFSQGMTRDGYFLDCWPAYDRLARLMERQLQLTDWGPLVDHGIGFIFDCWHHYNYTGDLESVREPFPQLLRFAGYLRGIVRDGLLPVEDLGVPTVYIDVEAYRLQRHKQCALNLYAAAMLQQALAPLCRAFGDERQAEQAGALGRDLQAATVARFWDDRRGVFVNNLPWLAEEPGVRLCDRSLATSILFGQCPRGQTATAVKMLAECPPEMGFSYPCNAGWRLWALGQAGRVDVVVRDLRQRWATMDSVALNNTLQENWTVRPDSPHQWSHCAVVPLYVAYHTLAGLRPLIPGFARVELRPQLGGLEDLDITAFTARGPIRLAARGRPGAREVTFELPATCSGELVLPDSETVSLVPRKGPVPAGCRRYDLPSGTTTLHLKSV